MVGRPHPPWSRIAPFRSAPRPSASHLVDLPLLSHRHRTATAVLASAVVTIAAFVAVGSAAGGSSRSVLRLDWRSGTNAAFSTLECPNPDEHFRIVRNPTRTGRPVARFTVSERDRWVDGVVRCLDANYTTAETVGQTFFYGFSLYVPRPGLSNNLIWELHQPESLWSVRGCGLAPYALIVEDNEMRFRISTGNCVVGRGNVHRELNIPIPTLETYPRNRWIDFVIRISFSERDGSVDLWSRTVGQRWPTQPQVQRRHIPTLPYCSSCNVHDVKLYTEMGLYPGTSRYRGSDMIYLAGSHRGPTFQAVAPR